jgi:hypothetical protein
MRRERRVEKVPERSPKGGTGLAPAWFPSGRAEALNVPLISRPINGPFMER